MTVNSQFSRKLILPRTRRIINMSAFSCFFVIIMQMMTVMSNSVSPQLNHLDVTTFINNFIFELHNDSINGILNSEGENSIYFPVIPWHLQLQNTEMLAALTPNQSDFSKFKNEIISGTLGIYEWESQIFLDREKLGIRKMKISEMEKLFKEQWNYGKIVNYDVESSRGKKLMTSFETIKLEKFGKLIGEINEWFEGKTKGLMKNIIGTDEMPENTEGIIFSTFHFHYSWRYSFNTEEKNAQEFFFPNGRSTIIPMMENVELYNYGNLLIPAKYIVIPLKNDRMNMIIILPNKNVDLEEIERKMKDVKLSELLATKPEVIRLYFPKFQFRKTRILYNSTLIDNSLNADPIKYRMIFHKTYLDSSSFDSGTKLTSDFTRRNIDNFIVNRPFLVLICRPYKHGETVLFYARVSHPSS